MAVLNLTKSYFHRVSDLTDFVSFPEASSQIMRGTRSEVETYSNENRRVVASPADTRSITLEIPTVPKSTVIEIEKLIDQVVLYRSPTGDYEYAQLLNVRRKRNARQNDRLLAGASIGLEPVRYPGLI